MTNDSAIADPHARLVEIIQLGNEYVEEAALVQAVVERLKLFGFAAHVMVRMFDESRTLLVPVACQSEYDSELEAEVSKLIVPAIGSLEGHATATNTLVVSTTEQTPDLDYDPDYVQDALHLITLGMRSAFIIPLTAQETIGAISFYGFDDKAFDERGLELAHRAGRVLASGIEKCRLLAQADAQRLELIRANDQLESSNRDLQDFAYVASHDLQEPLRKIQTFGDRLETKAFERLSDSQRADLARMSDASKRMQELINDLLRFSRATTRGGNAAPVNVGEVVVSAVEQGAGAIAASNADIQVADLPTAWCDHAQLTEVFSTLISNSIKYRQPDSDPVIEIGVDRRSKAAAPSSDDTISIIYRDNAIGFDPKFNERVFQPFFRLHSHAEFEGSGIGLAVCQRILQRYDGSISASSQEGHGTVFTINLQRPPEPLDESVDEPNATSA